MADTRGTITYRQLVNEIMFLGRYHEDELYTVKQVLANVIRHHRMFNLPEYRNTMRVTLDSNNAITLPSDYISFVSLSVAYQNRYWTFTRNGQLAIHTTLTDGSETIDIGVENGIRISDTGGYYGYGVRGAKNPYFYRLDEKNGRIFVNGFPREDDPIYLEYVSSGLSLSDETLIPTKWKDVLIAHVRYEMADLLDEQEYKIRRLKAKYEELRNMTRDLNWNINDFIDTWFKSSSQAPKRTRETL